MPRNTTSPSSEARRPPWRINQRSSNATLLGRVLMLFALRLVRSAKTEASPALQIRLTSWPTWVCRWLDRLEIYCLTNLQISDTSLSSFSLLYKTSKPRESSLRKQVVATFKATSSGVSLRSRREILTLAVSSRCWLPSSPTSPTTRSGTWSTTLSLNRHLPDRLPLPSNRHPGFATQAASRIRRNIANTWTMCSRRSSALCMLGSAISTRHTLEVWPTLGQHLGRSSSSAWKAKIRPLMVAGAGGRKTQTRMMY